MKKFRKKLCSYFTNTPKITCSPHDFRDFLFLYLSLFSVYFSSLFLYFPFLRKQKKRKRKGKEKEKKRKRKDKEKTRKAGEKTKKRKAPLLLVFLVEDGPPIAIELWRQRGALRRSARSDLSAITFRYSSDIRYSS